MKNENRENGYLWYNCGVSVQGRQKLQSNKKGKDEISSPELWENPLDTPGRQVENPDED